jgi:hypothetical protein
LEQSSDLGFPAAAAILETLKVRKIDLLPSVRNMGWQTNGGWAVVECVYPNMNAKPDVVKR